MFLFIKHKLEKHTPLSSFSIDLNCFSLQESVLICATYIEMHKKCTDEWSEG